MTVKVITMKLPRRKSPRLKNFDYSTPGYYFVTFCTHNRRRTLSHIVGAVHEPPETRLTEQGKIVNDVIINIPEHLGIKIDKYVIMPNHIHMIMIIEHNEHLRAIRESPLHSRQIIEKAVGYIKMNSSKRIRKSISCEKIWQRSFHDHIIRGEKDYQKIWQYINCNPMCWENDCFYSEI